MTILTEKPTLFVVARKNELIKKYGESFQIRDSETKEIKKKWSFWLNTLFMLILKGLKFN